MGKRNARRRRNEKAPVETPRAGSKKLALDPGLSRSWLIGLILAATFIIFSNSIFNGFAYDDQTQILGNTLIRSFSNIPTAFTKEVWFWRVIQDKDPNKELGPTTPYYRPVFTVYLMIGWHLFGTQAAGWHFINVLMHLIAVYFVFLILEKVTGDQRLSAVATLLFGLHPLRSESVAWISGVTDLFLALFLLPSFYFYLRFRESDEAKHLAASLGLFLLAAFSKEPAAALPIFIGAYEFFMIKSDAPISKRLLSALLYSSAFVLVCVIYFVARKNALGFVFNDVRFAAYPFWQILLTIPLVICKYLGLLVWPFWPRNLTLFHTTSLLQSPTDPEFLVPALVVAALAIGAWYFRKSPVFTFAVLWFAIQLLPVLNLGAFAEEFMVQERYVYIPSIGFSLLLGMAILKLPVHEWLALGSHRTAQAATIGILAVALGGTALAQNAVWKDDMTLWKYGVDAAPEQTMPYYILGHKYINLNQPDKVVESLEAFVKLNPNNAIVMTNLAAAHLMVYETSGDRSHIDRGIAVAEKGLQLNDLNAALWDTLGHAYTYETELKNYDRARACFARGLQLQPDNAMINFHMGASFAKQGQNDYAIRYLETARNLEPSLPDIYKFLAYAYQGKERIPEAISNFSEYLQRNPNASDAVTVSQNIEKLRARLNGQASS